MNTHVAFNHQASGLGLGLSSTKWREFRRVPCSTLPRQWRSWVLDSGSLTKRLMDASHGNFHVRVLREGWMVPWKAEAQKLGLKARSRAWIREVELVCRGETWVKARSVIPMSTLSGAERELSRLGSKPLGAFLFKARTMRRSPMAIAKFSDQSTCLKWGRSSVFYLHGKPVLVSELFMEALPL